MRLRSGHGCAPPAEEHGHEPGEEDPEYEDDGDDDPHAALGRGGVPFLLGRLGLGQLLIAAPADGAFVGVVYSAVGTVHEQPSGWVECIIGRWH